MLKKITWSSQGLWQQTRDAHQHQNRGLGVTKTKYLDATMDCMDGVFNTQYDKRFDTAANELQDDGSKNSMPLQTTMYAYWSRPTIGDYCR